MCVSSLLTSRPICLQTTLSYMNMFSSICTLGHSNNSNVMLHLITDDDHQVLRKGLNTFQELSDRWLLKLNVNNVK